MLDILIGIVLGLVIGWLVWNKFPKIGDALTVALIAAKNTVVAWVSALIKKRD